MSRVAVGWNFVVCDAETRELKDWNSCAGGSWGACACVLTVRAHSRRGGNLSQASKQEGEKERLSAVRE
eukprot:2329238-Rhodomonas_salina.2